TVKVCYTDGSGVGLDTADPSNMRYTGNGNTWSITNSKAPAQTIQLIKVDKNNTATVLDGAKFDLYGADVAGNIETTPIPGYTDLTSGANGVFSPGNFEIPYGTYYLVETQAPVGYEPLAGPVKLNVTAGGVTASVNGNALSVTQSGTTYAVRVTNQKLAANLTITKQVVGAVSTESFPMTATLDSGIFTIPAGVTGCTLSADGKTASFSLAHNESVRLEVPIGATVTLTETSHDGFYTKSIQGGTSTGEGDSADILILRDTDVTVQNSAGYELPKTGGAGTTLYTLGGLLLMAGAVMYGCATRRRREGRGD
ncbi:MAG: prealbumin-like fold domain-containing protein, partial [Methanocorpusculum sp.]|nr:prealbumin-like fold domain-containing protein [Methanocorpusculum sp.]